MPTSEYVWECGNKFEKIMRMSERHNAKCSCGATPELQISRVGFRMAEFFSVLDHKGNILSQTQTIEAKSAPPGYRYDNDNIVEV